MKLLLIGGSGQLSGRVAELAMEQGHEVWAVTRGIRPLLPGVHGLKADREDPEQLRAALASAGVQWDAAIDSTCRNEQHARVNLAVLPEFVQRLAVVSTDSVYHPAHKDVPQTESADYYMEDGGYGHHKRLMELVYLEEKNDLAWTIFRPGHIYGPGFELGCYPEQSRQKDLLDQIRADKPMRLVGGGRFLIHPIYVDDMALALLDCLDKSEAICEIFCIGGPEAVPNSVYYELIGEWVGHPVTIEDIPLEGYLEANPVYSGHLCHRSYDLSKLQRVGIRMPSMPLKDGLKSHIDWLDRRAAGQA